MGCSAVSDDKAYTGFRLTTAQLERANALTSRLGVSRNRLIGLLIDNARIESKPRVTVDTDGIIKQIQSEV